MPEIAVSDLFIQWLVTQFFCCVVHTTSVFQSFAFDLVINDFKYVFFIIVY